MCGCNGQDGLQYVYGRLYKHSVSVCTEILYYSEWRQKFVSPKTATQNIMQINSNEFDLKEGCV